ncbi:MAG: polyketide cyclase [Candidatus Roizmanbacteria bacterium]|nr:polyketide cyclase [Candidatus Roizmanbacteria bacterium]
MNTSSWMMGGGKMNTYVDQLKGKEVGSHIKMDGNVFGMYLSLDEVVTVHEPPRLKIWKTVGTPKLLIIGQYKMKIEIKPDGSGSLLRVSIDYELPKTLIWLGKIFSGWYAKWRVRQMLY